MADTEAADNGDEKPRIEVPQDPKERAKRQETAEVKLRRLTDKRNELNQVAREARGVRDQLNEERRKIIDRVKELREERDGINARIQEHKAKRNAYQQQAKALIARKRGVKDGLPTDARSRLSFLEREIERMEMEHTTSPMSVEKERDFLEKLREHHAEADSLKEVVSEGERITGQLDDIDDEIDRLFKLADDEHNQLVELAERGQALHDRIQPIYDEADQVRAKADEVHHESVDAQERANKYHEKAVALIQELEAIRGESRAEREEMKQAMAEQKRQATEALEPDEEVYDAFVEKLKKGEKIEF